MENPAYKVTFGNLLGGIALGAMFVVIFEGVRINLFAHLPPNINLFLGARLFLVITGFWLFYGFDRRIKQTIAEGLTIIVAILVALVFWYFF